MQITRDGVMKEDFKKLLNTIDEKQTELKEVLNPEYLYNPSTFEHIKVLLTYNSNAIEGNTLSHMQTATFIEKGLTSEGKTINEHYEAINHYKAFNYVYERSLNSKSFTQRDILNIHENILNKINDREKGCYRKVAIRISGSQTILPNAFQVPPSMEELEKKINITNIHPVLKAIDAHYDLVSIHPFVDGNGRTARLLMNGILLQNNYPILNIEKEKRNEYLNSLEAKQTNKNCDLYTKFMLEQLITSSDYYLSIKKEMNLNKTGNIETSQIKKKPKRDFSR